jgi:hypothetical protein
MDRSNRRLTGVRRATQFKGIVKSRLVTLSSNALKLVSGQIFRLDPDFDLLIDSGHIHVYRPSGFEFVGELQQIILKAVKENLTEIARDLPFIDFTNVIQYAASHPRAARYIASIRDQEDTRDIDVPALRALCKATGVEITNKAGRISVAPPTKFYRFSRSLTDVAIKSRSSRTLLSISSQQSQEARRVDGGSRAAVKTVDLKASGRVPWLSLRLRCPPHQEGKLWQ